MTPPRCRVYAEVASGTSLRSGVMGPWQCFRPLRSIFFRTRSKQNVSIFVGNLPFRAEQEDVTELFAQFGDCLLYTSPSPRDS